MNRSTVLIGKRSAFGARIWLAVVVIAAAITGYLMYDLGLSKAGFRSSEAAREIGALKADKKALSKANKELSERVAVLETAAKIDKEAYRQVDARIAELQAKIVDQQEDIEFYRGIVGEDDGSELRIQSFQILAGVREQEFELRLVLAQALRASREISGKVELEVEGLQRGENMTLGLADLAQAGLTGGADTLSYGFRYFEDLKATITLPADFEPRRVRVIVRPQGGRGKSAKTVEEFYAWQPENS